MGASEETAARDGDNIVFFFFFFTRSETETQQSTLQGCKRMAAKLEAARLQDAA
jgi:hypothetical protein